MTLVEQLTHDDIALVASKRLKSMGYIAALANVTSAAAGEQPDALGINSAGITFLVEAKVSRADFLADKKKPWRRDSQKSLGHYRAFITPKGLLKPEEIPYGWQLWEVHGKNKPIVKIIKGLVKEKKEGGICNGWTAMIPVNATSEELNHFINKASAGSALGLLATVLSRMTAEGIDIQSFASRHGKGFLKN